MDRYEEYKDSGVEWIGEIPAGWEVRRISSLYEARNEKVSDRDYPPLSVTMQGIVPQLETAAKTQDGENRKLVKSGDFAINSRSDRRGACGISAYDGSVTLITNVLAPKDQASMNPRYYSHLFRSEGFADEYYRQGTGIVDDLWSTNWTRMKNILVACPSLVEQASIAEYLDAKTTEIDSLVEDCEREVELLQEYRKAVISEAVTKGLDPNAPMKDSGIDWIGEIPEGWEVGKVKYAYINRDSERVPVEASKRNQSAEVLYPYYGASGVVDFISDFIFDEPLLLIGEDGANLRLRNLPLIYAANGRYWVNNHAHILQPAEMMDYRYSFYQLELVDLENYLTGSTQPKLTAENLGLIPVAMPSMREQQEIAAYLDVKTAEIDSFIADYRSIADKLREYRKSLISEAVTGKFKVPGVA